MITVTEYSCYMCGRNLEGFSIEHKTLPFEVENGEEMPVCMDCHEAFSWALTEEEKN